MSPTSRAGIGAGSAGTSFTAPSSTSGCPSSAAARTDGIHRPEESKMTYAVIAHGTEAPPPPAWVGERAAEDWRPFFGDTDGIGIDLCVRCFPTSRGYYESR